MTLQLCFRSCRRTVFQLILKNSSYRCFNKHSSYYSALHGRITAMCLAVCLLSLMKCMRQSLCNVLMYLMFIKCIIYVMSNTGWISTCIYLALTLQNTSFNQHPILFWALHVQCTPERWVIIFVLIWQCICS